MNNANNKQVGGQHYQSMYQHWDFVRLCLGGRYLEGCVTKYVARWRKKNGLQDLEKALHYLDKIIELFNGEQYESGVFTDPPPEFRATEFARLNGLGSKETYIVCALSYWNNEFVLLEVREQLCELIQEAKSDIAKSDAIKAGAGQHRGIGGGPGHGGNLTAGLGLGCHAGPGVRAGAGHEPGEEPGPGYVNQG